MVVASQLAIGTVIVGVFEIVVLNRAAAVVACKDQQCIVADTSLFQRRDDPANRIVEVHDARSVVAWYVTGD